MLQCSARALDRLPCARSWKVHWRQNWTLLYDREAAMLQTAKHTPHRSLGVATGEDHRARDRNFQNADDKRQCIATVRDKRERRSSCMSSSPPPRGEGARPPCRHPNPLPPRAWRALSVATLIHIHSFFCLMQILGLIFRFSLR